MAGPADRASRGWSTLDDRRFGPACGEAELARGLAEIVAVQRRNWLALRADLKAGLGWKARPRAFVVAIGGSVAVGKSRLAQELARALAPQAKVAVVAGDSFLLPNDKLAKAELLARKGFPESFDSDALRGFRQTVRAGAPEIVTPVYSHETYDIVRERTWRADRPEVLIFEGVHALREAPGEPRLHDFGVYLDAAEADLQRWYVERFLRLGRQRSPALAARAAALARAGGGAESLAVEIWRDINLPNLREHIAPTIAAADLVLETAGEHQLVAARLRA